MRKIADDMQEGGIRQEVRREQMYNLLVKDKFDAIHKRISWIKALLAIVTMAVAFDIMMDMFGLW